MFMWFSVTETYRWSGWTSSSFVIDIFFVWKIFCDCNTAFDYLLMLTIFHVQNVLIILDWCLCDFLLLKHIDEVDGLHLHLSLTYFLCGKYSTIAILLLIIYWCWLFFMCKMFLSFSTDVYVIFCYWNISMKWMDFIFICDWHIFCVENILQLQYCFWLFTDVDYFSCAKCSYHSRLMFMWVSVTETYQWSGWASSSFVIDIFLCGKYSMIAILLLIIYWCWLFFMCKMFLSLSNWYLCDFLVLKHIDGEHKLHLYLSFTDVDIFSCWKCPTISILFLIIYWCWLFFLCKMFLSCSYHIPEFQYCFWLFTDVDYFSCAKVSLRKFP